MRVRYTNRLGRPAGAGCGGAGDRLRRCCSVTSPVVGHVYVNDNTAGKNTIAGFDRHADGTLTPTSGSPFATGGAGTGTGLAISGRVAAQHGRPLSARRRRRQQPGLGASDPARAAHCTRVSGGTVSSHGIQPVSIAVHRNLVYVANAGNGGSNYTGFRLDSSGTCGTCSGSTVALPDGSQPGDVLFNSTGTKLAGTRVEHVADR